MDIAIIAGASSLVGAEFAETLERSYSDIDELWLISGQKNHLSQLAAKYVKIKTVPVPLDLSEDMSFDFIGELLSGRDIRVKLLINAASYCEYMSLEASDRKALDRSINMNVKSAVMLERICMPYLGSGSTIINVGSVMAYAPLAMLSVSGAGRAFTAYHTNALREELKERGINVMLLTLPEYGNETDPGIAETDTKKAEGKLDLREVTERAVELAQKGRAAYTPGTFYKLIGAAGRLFPGSVAALFKNDKK